MRTVINLAAILLVPFWAFGGEPDSVGTFVPHASASGDRNEPYFAGCTESSAGCPCATGAACRCGADSVCPFAAAVCGDSHASRLAGMNTSVFQLKHTHARQIIPAIKSAVAKGLTEQLSRQGGRHSISIALIPTSSDDALVAICPCQHASLVKQTIESCDAPTHYVVKAQVFAVVGNGEPVPVASPALIVGREGSIQCKTSTGEDYTLNFKVHNAVQEANDGDINLSAIPSTTQSAIPACCSPAGCRNEADSCAYGHAPVLAAPASARCCGDACEATLESHCAHACEPTAKDSDETPHRDTITFSVTFPSNWSAVESAVQAILNPIRQISGNSTDNAPKTEAAPGDQHEHGDDDQCSSNTDIINRCGNVTNNTGAGIQLFTTTPSHDANPVPPQPAPQSSADTPIASGHNAWDGEGVRLGADYLINYPGIVHLSSSTKKASSGAGGCCETVGECQGCEHTSSGPTTISDSAPECCPALRAQSGAPEMPADVPRFVVESGTVRWTVPILPRDMLVRPGSCETSRIPQGIAVSPRPLDEVFNPNRNCEVSAAGTGRLLAEILKPSYCTDSHPLQTRKLIVVDLPDRVRVFEDDSPSVNTAAHTCPSCHEELGAFLEDLLHASGDGGVTSTAAAEAAGAESPQALPALTHSKIETTVVTYPLRDLVLLDDAGRPVFDTCTIIDHLEGAVAPESWSHPSVSVQLDQQSVSLVIRQTPEVHKQIASHLRYLRRLQVKQICNVIERMSGETESE